MSVSVYFNYALAGLGLVVLAYVIVRVGSFAYFRTKYEHLKSVLRLLRQDGGDSNG